MATHAPPTGDGRKEDTQDVRAAGTERATKSPLSPLIEDLIELREYAMYYVAARVDAIKHQVRSTLVRAAAAMVGMVAGAVILATAIVLLLEGIAAGLAALLGGRRWAGDLITGGVLLGVIALVGYVAVRVWIRSSWHKTVNKYDRRRDQEREQIGRDVRQRAAQRRTTI